MTPPADGETRSELGSRFRVGGWVVEPRRNAISRGDGDVVLEPKVMRLLVRLAEADGSVVTRDELHADLWPGTFVTDKALTGAVSKLRRALGDDPQAPRYLETISKAGYRLVAEVASVDEEAAPNSAPAPGRARSPARARRPRSTGVRARAGMPAAVAALALLVVAGVVAVGALGGEEGALEVMPDATARALTTDPGHELEGALSPGGQDVAYTRSDGDDNWDIWIRRIGSAAELRLTDDPANDVRPTWSPDGSRIAFLRFDDEQCRVLIKPALGGPERRLAWCSEFLPARVPFGPSLAWSPDGRWIARPWRDAADEPAFVQLIEVDTGRRLRVTRPESGFGDRDPSFSPDGRQMAFTRHRRGGPSDLWAVELGPDGESGDDLVPGPERRLTREPHTLLGHAWLRDGSGVVVSSTRGGTFGLWIVGLVGGEPRWLPAPGENLKEPSISADGERLVYESWRYDTNLWRIPLGGMAGSEIENADAGPVLRSSLWDMHPAHSPDGREIAFVSNRGGGHALWIAEGTDGEAWPVAQLDGAPIGGPAWFPDGKRLVFEAWPDGNADLWVLERATGTLRRLTRSAADETSATVTADGEHVVYASNAGGSWAIWRMRIDGSGARVLVEGPAWIPRLSRDGASVLFMRPGEHGLWRVPSTGGRAELVLEVLAASDRGNWAETPDGALIFVDRSRVPGGELARADLASGHTEVIAALPTMPLQHPVSLSVAPDASHVLLAGLDETEADLMLVERLLGR